MWARLLNAGLGVWLMAAPDVLDYTGRAATNDRIVGPILATFAICAIWQIARSLRWLNLLLGVWLLIAPWVLWFGWTATINSVVVGAAVIGLSLVRGTYRHTYGGGWASLWRGDGARATESTYPPLR